MMLALTVSGLSVYACSRWIHEECVENVIRDTNGKELLCPVFVVSVSISSGLKKKHDDPLCTIDFMLNNRRVYYCK